jgi:hypothetical protein
VRLLLISATVILAGCTASEVPGFGSGARGAEDHADPPIAVDTSALCPATACGDEDCSSGSSVQWQLDHSGSRPCPVPGVCDADYFAFLGLAAEHGTPLSSPELSESIRALIDGEVDYETDPIDNPTLREVVIEATNLRFLLDGIDQRSLLVREVGQQVLDRGIQVDLVIEDPWVGSFQAILLLPFTDAPHSGVVAHPGHWEEAWEHRDQRHALKLLEAGIAVAIIDPRAHEGDLVESEVTEALLLAGHSFMAVRVYETLLLRRVLQAHPDVHPLRIGLMGHSGGSASGNLALRVDEGWAAYASDFLTEYLYANPDGTLVDETVPSLHPWFGKINQLSTAASPTRLFEYGFPEGGDELVGFFCDHLSDE